MNDLAFHKLLLFGGFCCALLLRIDISETVNFVATYISIGSFVVILISNWFKLMRQLKQWNDKFKKKKNDKKRKKKA